MSQDTSHIDPRLLEKKREMENKLSEDIILSDLRAIHSIYFDLPLLQEIRIGALLLLAKDEEEYNNILSRIPIYLARVDTDICKYFNTHYTDEEVHAFIKDPKNAEYLYKASPHTNLWFYLPTLFSSLVDNNRLIGKQQQYTVYVNIHTTGYTPVVCKVMTRYFQRIGTNIAFKTIHKPFYELSQYTRLTPELYFMEDMGDIFDNIKHPNTALDVYSQNAYDNKFVFGRKLITTDDVTADLETAFSKSKHFFNIFTNFNYIDIAIPGVEYVTPVVDEGDTSTT